MSEIKFCRICLDKNVRMHQISRSDVQDVYEKLTNQKIKQDGRLYFACYICYSRLRNSQQLVVTSQKSELLLKQMLSKRSGMDFESISFVDRTKHGLHTSLKVTKMESVQIPLYNEMIKTEIPSENVTFEVMIKQEPLDDGAFYNNEPQLDMNHTFVKDRHNYIENGMQEMYGTENKSFQIVSEAICGEVTFEENKKPYICNDCGEVYETKQNLTTHISGHKPTDVKLNTTFTQVQKSQSDGKFIENNSKNQSAGDRKRKLIKCQYCSYASRSNGDLKKHVRTHTGEKPFKCQYCSYECAQNSSLKAHIRTHTGEKPFKCQRCSYTCKTSSTLKEHIRTHTGEKPFQCQYCNYTSAGYGNLKTHIRTHTGEKPFKCQYCSYKCAHSSSLKIHLRSHAEDKGIS